MAISSPGLPPLWGSLRNAGFLPATFCFELPTIQDIGPRLFGFRRPS